ncbi:MAG: hypothetical protein PQJ59_16960 [Spirochaetales bacterium]|nr:hypothetical protein [Spirochaetales bacterium]
MIFLDEPNNVCINMENVVTIQISTTGRGTTIMDIITRDGIKSPCVYLIGETSKIQDEIKNKLSAYMEKN